MEHVAEMLPVWPGVESFTVVLVPLESAGTENVQAPLLVDAALQAAGAVAEYVTLLEAVEPLAPVASNVQVVEPALDVETASEPEEATACDARALAPEQLSTRELAPEADQVKLTAWPVSTLAGDAEKAPMLASSTHDSLE